MSISVAFFISDGFQPLDLYGPLDTFDEVNSIETKRYSSQIVSFTAGPVKSFNGHTTQAEKSISDVTGVDYLVICGGSGMRQLRLSLAQKQALRKVADSAKKVISICTGAFVLAQIYDDQPLTLTTHWKHCQELAQRSPHVTVLAEPLYINRDRIWSSAGVLSGVDLALAIIRLDCSNTTAASVAKQLVMYLQRKGNQNQYSDQLHLQSSQSLRLAPLIEWIKDNIHKPISVQAMAEQAFMSPRQLTRLFKQQLSHTPAQFLNQLRVSLAKDMLSDDNRTLHQLAANVGFKNYDSFRRSFERHYSVAPSKFHK